MKILIACERSQVITKAFRKRGFNAFSCDIEDQTGGFPEWHIKEDARNVICNGWDLMIAHPPCTYLANSGVSWLWNKDKTQNTDRWLKMNQATEFFYELLNAPVKHIAIENPIPHKYALLPKYSQIIQPYMFGHLESKATCLWLKNLPLLKETNNVKKEMLLLPKNKSQRLHYLPPGPKRQELRSKTFEGIGEAIADQWSKILL